MSAWKIFEIFHTMVTVAPIMTQIDLYRKWKGKGNLEIVVVRQWVAARISGRPRSSTLSLAKISRRFFFNRKNSKPLCQAALFVLFRHWSFLGKLSKSDFLKTTWNFLAQAHLVSLLRDFNSSVRKGESYPINKEMVWKRIIFFLPSCWSFLHFNNRLYYQHDRMWESVNDRMPTDHQFRSLSRSALHQPERSRQNRVNLDWYIVLFLVVANRFFSFKSITNRGYFHNCKISIYL